ncbi:MAG TPA: DUF4476 domain-containing protein [Chitinophagaceae bacterium]|jgi:hypothetical protein|nr:DUF4476 domain-containing protein [Chitinophagaceae bacterium]
MKKFFTLLLSSLFSLSLLAFDGSRLSISAPGTTSELKIEIDGRPFSMKNNSITVGYLGEGRHNVKIYKEAKRTQTSFGRREIVYNSTINLKRGFHLDITVNRFGKVLVDERRINVNDEWYNDEDEYYDHEGWDNSMDKMSVREFETLKESLRKEWFENNRLTSVKVILEKSNFSTSQVKDLMLLFSFESNRLEIAKAAYHKTIDKENYYQLNEALTFSSSKDDLARFIRESH